MIGTTDSSVVNAKSCLALISVLNYDSLMESRHRLADGTEF